MKQSLASTAITVVVPFYRGNTHLNDTLRSIASQTLAPIDVIIVDDGGPERPMIADEPWPFALEVHLTENRGEQAARNLGAALASTEYVTFVDQDDLWLPHHLETMAAGLASLPQGSVLAPRLQHFVSGTEDAARQSVASTSIEYTPVSVDLQWQTSVSNTVFARRLDYITWGGFPTVLRGVGDFLICARLAAAGVLHQPSEPTVLYRWHSEMSTLGYHMDANALSARALLVSAGMGGSESEWTYRAARLIAADPAITASEFTMMLATAHTAGVPLGSRLRLVAKHLVAKARQPMSIAKRRRGRP